MLIRHHKREDPRQSTFCGSAGNGNGTLKVLKCSFSLKASRNTSRQQVREGKPTHHVARPCHGAGCRVHPLRRSCAQVGYAPPGPLPPCSTCRSARWRHEGRSLALCECAAPRHCTDCELLRRSSAGVLEINRTDETRMLTPLWTARQAPMLTSVVTSDTAFCCALPRCPALDNSA